MDSSRSSKLTGSFALVLLCGPLLLSGLASAQSLRLSGALAHELRTGNVSDYLFNSDGSRVVYRADRAASGVFELFSVPTDGSGPLIRLNGPLPAGGDVAGSVFGSRDLGLGTGDRVAYRADQTTLGTFELYSVPADGSASPLRLSPALTHVARFWISPAGDQVFYTDPLDLYRVPLDGSAMPIPIAAGLEPHGLVFSPDGSRLLLGSPSPQGLAREHLYSVPADGSAAPVLLDESQPSGFEFSHFDHLRFASDGVHLLYDDILPFESYLYTNLLSVPLDGSQAPTQIDTGALDQYAGNFGYDENSGLHRVAFLEAGVVFSAAFDGTQRVALTPAGWTSDYDRVIVSGSDVLFGAHTATVTSVHRAPLDGSSVGVPLFPGLTTFGYVKQIEVLGSTVVFLAGDGFRGIYAVPLAGGTPVLLNPPVISQRGAYSFEIHPDGQRVVFLASPFPATGGLVELFIAPLDGSHAPLKLNGPITGNGDVDSFLLSPDGVSVAYLANPTGSSALHGVFGATLDGLGPVVQHNEPGPGTGIGGDVLDYVPSQDGELVVYRADGDLDESFQLFAVDTLASESPVSLTALLPDTSDVLPGFALTPAGDRVVFQTAEGAQFKLFSAPTTPGPAPTELDTSNFAFPLPLVVSPDGTRVVYREKTSASVDHALRSALLDGSSPPVTLHAPLAAGRQVIDFLVSPDGLSVVYRADKARLGQYELFRSPLDGSTPAVRLHGLPVSGRWVWLYKISPDSSRVVFRANLRVTAEMDVYSAPILGDSAPQRLNNDLTPNGGVTDFVISENSKAIAFRASTVHPNNNSQQDLFYAPIQRHGLLRRTSNGEIRGGVVRLTQLPSGSVDSDYRFAAGGTQVLYRANPTVNTRRELFRVAVDGSGPAVQLSSPMASNRSVNSFALSPDQSTVVYLADANTNEVLELFRVPLAGGAVVALDQPFGFADVSSYQIDALSERVVFLADRLTDGALELFAVPLDASTLPERQSGALPPGGDVESDYFLLPGGRALYRADQETNDVLELFVTLG